MAKDTGKGSRKRAVTARTQSKNPKMGDYTKRTKPRQQKEGRQSSVATSWLLGADPILQEYYLRVTRNPGNFIAELFVPNLAEAQAFFTELAAEIRAAVPSGKMIILMKSDSDGGSHSFSFIEYPEDVLS